MRSAAGGGFGLGKGVLPLRPKYWHCRILHSGEACIGWHALATAGCPGARRAVYSAWCGGVGSVASGPVPLPLPLLAQALTFLGGELLEALPPLLAQALTFLGGELLEPLQPFAGALPLLGGKIAELLVAFPEGLTPFGGKLLPAVESLPEVLTSLRGELPPTPVVFSDLLLLRRGKLPEGFQSLPQGLLLL